MASVDAVMSKSFLGTGSLSPFLIESLTPSFYYIPDFITEEEEASILQRVRHTAIFASRRSLTPVSQIPSQRWVTLSHRRLQAHPSTLTGANTLLAGSLPPYLVNPIVPRFEALGVFNGTPHCQPNHVLINEYRRGEGIMPHEDGSAYADVVATVSLGAAVCLDITEKARSSEVAECSDGREKGSRVQEQRPALHLLSQHPARILQERRSLLITTGAAYTDLLHGISAVATDEDLCAETVANWDLLGAPLAFEADRKNERGTRVSLTYRDVLKVNSAVGKVLGRLGRR